MALPSGLAFMVIVAADGMTTPFVRNHCSAGKGVTETEHRGGGF
jgi:hypothetical protein